MDLISKVNNLPSLTTLNYLHRQVSSLRNWETSLGFADQKKMAGSNPHIGAAGRQTITGAARRAARLEADLDMQSRVDR